MARQKRKLVPIRLSEEEKQTLVSQAQRLGYKNFTDMIRNLAKVMHENPPIPPPVPPPVPKEVISLTVQLSQVGNNNNQIARYLNAQMRSRSLVPDDQLKRIQLCLEGQNGHLELINRLLRDAYEAKE